MDDSLLLRGGTVVTRDGILTEGDVAVDGASGKIVAVGRNLPGKWGREVEVTGKWVFPGFVDAHVHFNEPGRTEWEGFASGSAALAAGGGTCFVEMPLNASPPTLDAASLALKWAAGEAESRLDFALWGGLTPVNLTKLGELAEGGVAGFKAFMSGSGMADFPRADERTLREGMRVAAGFGLPVLVHAESEEMTNLLASKARAAGRTGVRDYLASRPVEAEVEAIRLAIGLAGETGCRLHVVHVSSAAGLREVAAGRARGARVTAETCPHYLLLNEEETVRLGAPGKCAPPLRPEAERLALWDGLAAGLVTTIGSDHSPAPPEMKTGSDFFTIWGGISGCQDGFRLLLEAGLRDGRLEPVEWAALLAGNPAELCGLDDRKGAIAPGLDADLTVMEFSGAEEEITAGKLLYRHQSSVYCGRRTQARVALTLARGRVAGEGAARGKFLRRRERAGH